MKYKAFLELNELLKSPEPWKVHKAHKDFYTVKFEIEGMPFSFSASQYQQTDFRPDHWDLEFQGPGGAIGIMNLGKGRVFRIFSTVIDIFKAFIKKYKPGSFEFNAEEASRKKLYGRFAKLIKQQSPYQYELVKSKGKPNIYSKGLPDIFLFWKGEKPQRLLRASVQRPPTGG